MAANTGTPFSVLPQFQGNLYDLQTKQALAQALMQKGLQGDLENYRPTGGGYAYVPKYGAGSAIAQLGQALLGGALQQQASQGLTDLGAQQAAAYQQMFAPTTETQQATVDMPPTQQAPLSFGLGTGGGFTAGAPDAARAALGNALAPQVTRTTQAPLNPMGMNPQAAGFLAQTIGLPEFAKSFIAPSFKPTDATLAAMQGGFNPQLANQAQFRKDTYVPPTAGGAGTVYRDPFTNQVIGSNPNIGEGMQPVYDQSGRFVGTMPIAGYTGTVGAIEGARAQGRATGEVQQVFNPQTQQMEIVPRSQVLGAQGGATGGGLGTGRLGGGGGAFAAAPALGAPEAAAVEGKGQAEAGLRLQQEAGAAPQQRLFIRELRQTMQGFDPGNPKADWALTMKKMVNTANPFGNTFDPHKIASQEQFNKAANQLAMAQFKDLNSGGANSTLETSMKSNPNATISRLGNKGILDLLQGNVDAKERMGQEWQRWKESNGPGSYSKFQTEWSKSYDPQVFMVPYQSKEEAAKMVNAMTPQERKVFQQKFNFAVKNGWIQLPE